MYGPVEAGLDSHIQGNFSAIFEFRAEDTFIPDFVGECSAVGFLESLADKEFDAIGQNEESVETEATGLIDQSLNDTGSHPESPP